MGKFTDKIMNFQRFAWLHF